MIKKLLMAAAVVVMAVPAAAQGSRRSEVSVSYGVAPVTDWIDSYSDMLTGLFTNANTDLKGWGAVTVGYSFRLIGSLRLGAQVVYSSNTQEVRGAGSEIRNRYWSLLPNVKWNWMNLKVVSFYSRLGAGASFSRSEVGARAANPRSSPSRCRPSASKSGDASRPMPRLVSVRRAACWSASATASDTLSGYGKGAHSSQDAPLFVGGSPRRGVLTPSQALFRPSRSASCRRR